MMKNRKYLIIPTSQLDKVIIDEVCGDSIEDFRKSVDTNKVLIKWDKETPSFYDSLIDTQGPYSLEEILVILDTDQWSLQL
jgi:hypothetical protein